MAKGGRVVSFQIVKQYKHFCHVLFNVQKQKLNLNDALNVAFMLSHFNGNRSGGAMVYWVENQTLQPRNKKNALDLRSLALF